MTDSTVLPEVDINQIATDLNGKADKDLTNTEPSQTFKTSVIHLMMPDYSAGVSKTWGSSIRADKDGWLYVKGSGNSTDAAYMLEVSTNGSTWVRIASFWASTSTTGAVIIPVPKGMYYKASQSPTTSARELIFYPCIGA